MIKITFWLRVKGRKDLVKKVFRGDNNFSGGEAMERLREEMRGVDYTIEGFEFTWIEDPMVPPELKDRGRG